MQLLKLSGVAASVLAVALAIAAFAQNRAGSPESAVPAADSAPPAAVAAPSSAVSGPGGATGASAAALPAVGAHGSASDAETFRTKLLIGMLYVFVLSTFIGIGVIKRVSRLLHTPLMSLTNAISAIAVVGALIVAGGKDYGPGIRLLGAIAVFASMTNIISGFLITDRMLRMFRAPRGGSA